MDIPSCSSSKPVRSADSDDDDNGWETEEEEEIEFDDPGDDRTGGLDGEHELDVPPDDQIDSDDHEEDSEAELELSSPPDDQSDSDYVPSPERKRIKLSSKRKVQTMVQEESDDSEQESDVPAAVASSSASQSMTGRRTKKQITDNGINDSGQQTDVPAVASSSASQSTTGRRSKKQITDKEITDNGQQTDVPAVASSSASQSTTGRRTKKQITDKGITDNGQQSSAGTRAVGGSKASRAKTTRGRSRKPKGTAKSRVTSDTIYLEGMPPMPSTFAWNKDVPMKQKRRLMPHRPLDSTPFQPGTPLVDIFKQMFAPGRRLWIAGTNENGRRLYDSWKVLRKKEAHRFIAIIIYGGIMRTNRWDMYWRRNSIFSSAFVKQQMSHRRFLQIKNASRMYVESVAAAAGTNQPESDSFDPIHKIRPMMDALLRKFQDCLAPNKKLAIDEQMVKFLGRCKHAVVVKNKPIPRGIKLFLLCDSRTGYIHAAQMHYDHTAKDPDEQCRTIKMFLELLDGSTPKNGRSFLDQGLTVYCDNYFTMVRLFHGLRVRDTYACGTLRTNRRNLPKDIVASAKKRGQFLDKMQRGGYVFRFANTEFPMTYCGWQDNGPVHILSTCPEFGMDKQIVKRAGRAGSKIEVVCPSVVVDYTRFMRGVDLCDQKIAEQKEHHRRNKKWYTPLLYQMFDWTILNSTIIYNKVNGTALSSLEARKLLATDLGRAPNTERGDHQPTENVSMDRKNCRLMHFPGISEKPDGTKIRRYCVAHMQRKLVSTFCEACKVYLCASPCFRKFHMEDKYLFNDATMGRAPIYHSTQKY